MSFRSTVIAFALACWMPWQAAAQVMVSPTLAKAANKKSADASAEAVRLYPMQSPDPLLRYRLWPAPEDRRAENPTPLLNRAVMLLLKQPPEVRKQFVQRYGEWAEMPTEELPKDEVREMIDRFAVVLAELRRCDNLMRVEYELLLSDLSGPEIIQTLLPEFQEMRDLARLLNLDARLALAEGRWQDMVDDCRLGFRLAEIAAHSTDFLIGRMVGLAISRIIMSTIEDAIQQPDCPNLYWALASLPHERLFETRSSIEYETALFARVFANAGDLPDHPIGENAARDKIRGIIDDANMMLMNTGDRMAQASASALLAGLYVVALAEPSREMLAKTPEWADRAEDLSASEAVLRASQLKFSRLRDGWTAWSMLPPELWDEYGEERLASLGGDVAKVDVLQLAVRQLMPAVRSAHMAGRRSHQHRNLLLTLEAMRMHAAVEGDLPESTERLRPVPVGNDSVANQPFGYQRTSPDSAVLTRMGRQNANITLQIELRGAK